MDEDYFLESLYEDRTYVEDEYFEDLDPELDDSDESLES